MSIHTKAVIDLAAIRHNYNVARQAAPYSKVMAAIKSNAYGHGLVQVASALAEADAFGVARLEEALTLRNAQIKNRVVLLSELLNESELQLCAQQKLDLVVFSNESVSNLLSAKLAEPVSVWLKIDSGMHRLGIPLKQVKALYSQLKKSPLVDEIILMTHFHSADEINNPATDQQTDLFMDYCSELDARKSLANSAATLAWPRSHQDWIRPGIMLYGADPLSKANELSRQLKPVMQFSSRLIAINTIPAGASVGYNATWHSARKSTIGTIAAGYADGYPRHAGNGTPVLINKKWVPLVGRVSMDLITVDLSDHPEARVGDEVILWGKHLDVREIAFRSNTISYDLLTGIGKRVALSYI